MYLISANTYALIKSRVSCLEKGEIKAKGIEIPISTYQIQDFFEKLENQIPNFEASLNGMKIRADFSKIKQEQIIEAIDEALEELRSA